MTTNLKVFGIGLNKTGTSTLQHCFIALRIVPVASPSVPEYSARRLTNEIIKSNNYEPALAVASGFSAFEDRPWNVWDMYKHLNDRFSNSKFILTERYPEKWWKSVERWITVSKPYMQDLYQQHLKARSVAKADMIRAYNLYNEEVKEYFKGSNKLLVMNLEEGDGWNKLCSFLEKPVPKIPFPHANKQAYTQLDLIDKKHKRFKRKGLICMNCNEVLRNKKKDLKKGNQQSGRKFVIEHIAAGTARRLKDQFDIRRLGSSSSRVAHINRVAPKLSLDDFAVVTCFFNPARYSSRVKNYHIFNKGIKEAGVKLLTVELAFDDQEFQLGNEIGEVIRLRSSNILWQKERLLNIGIQELLRQGYKKIAWLDCDIVFDDKKEWPWYVSRELDKRSFCQVFSHAKIALDSNGRKQISWGAVRYYTATNKIIKQSLNKPKRNIPLGRPIGLSGLGWAARSEVLEKCLLYDGAILGGGDKMIYAASYYKLIRNGHLGQLTRSYYKCENCGHFNQSEPYKDHYQSWAKKWCKAVDGEPGFVFTGIKDLYHGERELRGYMERRETLFAYNYDPYNDIAIDENGCWQWSSDKPDFHHEIARYFLNRQEDR